MNDFDSAANQMLDSRLQVIQAVRFKFNLGLLECKKLVDDFYCACEATQQASETISQIRSIMHLSGMNTVDQVKAISDLFAPTAEAVEFPGLEEALEAEAMREVAAAALEMEPMEQAYGHLYNEYGDRKDSQEEEDGLGYDLFRDALAKNLADELARQDQSL